MPSHRCGFSFEAAFQLWGLKLTVSVYRDHPFSTYAEIPENSTRPPPPMYANVRIRRPPPVRTYFLRSVVSAANYAKRSSFAKDQILFFFLYRSEFSACKRGSHTTYFFVSSWSAYCCEVAMLNVVLIHRSDTVYLHQGVSYTAPPGLLTL